jgi:hypothetical protein
MIYRIVTAPLGLSVYVRAGKRDDAIRWAYQVGIVIMYVEQTADSFHGPYIFQAPSPAGNALEATKNQLRLYSNDHDQATKQIIAEAEDLLA